MYWRSGQRIIAAARFIREHPGLYPVYITNFGCGPDSFITHFFRLEMGDRPYLQLEIDEHSADAGAITRIEAFLDSLKNAGKESKRTTVIKRDVAIRKRKIFLPNMTDHAYALAASSVPAASTPRFCPNPTTRPGASVRSSARGGSVIRFRSQSAI
jgi:hypothetical protein